MRYRQLAQNVQNMAEHLLRTDFAQFNVNAPKIKIVNHRKAKWLGACKYDYNVDQHSSTIMIQVAATNYSSTLTRVLLHELIHHVEYQLTYGQYGEEIAVKNFMTAKKTKNYFHGAFFKTQCERLNAKYGQNYVSEFVDHTYKLQAVA